MVAKVWKSVIKDDAMTGVDAFYGSLFSKKKVGMSRKVGTFSPAQKLLSMYFS